MVKSLGVIRSRLLVLAYCFEIVRLSRHGCGHGVSRLCSQQPVDGALPVQPPYVAALGGAMLRGVR